MQINNRKKAILWGGVSYAIHCFLLLFGALIFHELFGKGVLASIVAPLITPFFGGVLLSIHIARLLNGKYDVAFSAQSYVVGLIIAIIEIFLNNTYI